MKKDLLVIYARNHTGPLLNALMTAFMFLAAKYKLYGLPHDWEAGGRDAALLGFSGLMLLRLRHLYQREISARSAQLQENEVSGLAREIVINKVLCLMPWLVLLFWPLQSQYVYDHLLGYIFVFAAMAVTASASAPLLFLLVSDIALLIFPAAAITYYNDAVQETPYIGGALLLFSGYAFVLGNKIRQSTIQLVESRQRAAQSAKRADDANRAKSSFLALMSHEIRTPMTGIFGMIDFLRETELSPQQKEFISTIRECSKTLLNTLNDILDLSKIESGKLAISRINYDFAGTLENSARVLQQLAVDKGLTLTTDIAPQIPPLVHGDPHRTQQVVLNLLNNAVKFTEKGGVTLKARFIDASPQKLRVEISDTGIGVSKENIGKLFGVFSQADASISRRYGGSGLGLSITKSLVELMGGKIGVTSEEGKGSIFWFELPYAAPVEGANDVFEAEQQDADEAVPPQRILVAEDNAVNQDIVKTLLERKGHSVTIAPDGEAAIAAAREGEFDLILMDINMPKKNGLEALRDIRALGKKYRKTPVIGLTANIMEDFVKKCREAGMVDFVAKPFAPKKLYSAISRTLLQRAEKEAAAAASRAPQVRPMKDCLAAIAAEMDADYLRTTVASSTKEIRRLAAAVKAAHRKKNYTEMAGAAHDLKAVAGMLGLQKTCNIAFTIEDCCNKNLHQGLLGQCNDLEHWLGREMKDLEAAMKAYRD